MAPPWGAEATPEGWLAGLPAERAEAVGRVRDLVNANLPEGWVERMAGSMIAWILPLETYPDTYNRQPLILASLVAQKNHNALYLMCAYVSEERTRRLEQRFRAAGKKIDMGKSCLRFKDYEDLAEEAVAETIRDSTVERYIADYEAGRAKAKS
ncbi:MAG TPA: DUF1801 domain-containing protein [Allosphingosinicella sp.]